MTKYEFVNSGLVTTNTVNTSIGELIRERNEARLDYVYTLHKIDRMERSEQSAKTIEKVIFNPPATIILWADGTKTVVKCQSDGLSEIEPFDPEKGLAMAFMKKMLGNKGNYYNTIDKWVHPYWQAEYDKRQEEIEQHWRDKFGKE